MRTRLEKALEYMAGYCAKSYSCDECQLYDEDEGRCMLTRTIPVNREVENGRTKNRVRVKDR